jgi:hypothetical protein
VGQRVHSRQPIATQARRMKNTIFDQLTRAIDGRHVVRLTDEAGERVVEPYLIFESAKGDMLLHSWQIAGAFRRTPPPHWCNLHLDDIVAVRRLPERFVQPQRDYNPRSAHFHHVIYEVDGYGPKRGASTVPKHRRPPRHGPPKRPAKLAPTRGGAARLRSR